VRKCDSELLFANFARTQSVSFYANIKQNVGQEGYIWQHDRRSTLLKFYLRSRSYGLEARMHHGPHHAAKKVCPFCTLQVHETEEHHLLRCTAFQPERSVFLDYLRTSSLTNFPVEIYEFVSAQSSKQVFYLLGRSEGHWNPEFPLLVDSLLRPFLLAPADKRKTLSKNRVST
jgi:hypothetical protein